MRSACRATLEASDVFRAVPRHSECAALASRENVSHLRCVLHIVAHGRTCVGLLVRTNFFFSIFFSNLVTLVSTALPRVGVERPNGSYVARTLKRVGRVISCRSQTNVTGDRHALTEHQLHGYEWRKEDSVFSSRFTCKP